MTLEELQAQLGRAREVAQELVHADWCPEHWYNQQDQRCRYTGCDCGLWALLVALGLRAPEGSSR